MFQPVFLFAASEDLTGLQLLLYNKPEKEIRLIPVNSLQFWQPCELPGLKAGSC